MESTSYFIFIFVVVCCQARPYEEYDAPSVYDRSGMRSVLPKDEIAMLKTLRFFDALQKDQRSPLPNPGYPQPGLHQYHSDSNLKPRAARRDQYTKDPFTRNQHMKDRESLGDIPRANYAQIPQHEANWPQRDASRGLPSAFELVKENAGCVKGAGLMISRKLSIEECGYQCFTKLGATMFRVGRPDGRYCRGENKCTCICPTKANPDTCVMLTTKGMDLYKINAIPRCDAKPCDINAKCVDRPGLSYCTCNPGYLGNGLKCYSLQNAQCGRRHASDTPDKTSVLTGLPRYRDWSASLAERGMVGKVAMPKDWPWMAYIRVDGHNTPYAGASIVNDRFLITLATGLTHFIRKDTLHKVRIYVGDWDWTRRGEEHEQSFRVKAVKLHENWDVTHKEDEYTEDLYNIALIEIEGRIKFSEYVKPIRMPRQAFGHDNRKLQNCYAGGWVNTDCQGKQSYELREVKMPRLYRDPNDRDANNWYCDDLSSDMFCIGENNWGGRETCMIEGTYFGGPIICEVGGRWEQVGIVTWVERVSKCRTMRRDLQNYRNWIDASMRKMLLE